MKKRITLASAVLGLAFAVGANAADTAADKATRVGTCEDAKKQRDYFCDESNAGGDTMVALGTACNNAKSNVKEACEGVVEDDKAYK